MEQENFVDGLAEVEYERGRSLFGDQWLWGDFFIMLIRLGMGNAMTSDMVPALKNNAITSEMMKHLDTPELGLEELRNICSRETGLSIGNLIDISFWAAHFGDAEFTMEVMQIIFKKSAERVSYFWLPVMKEVRQLPRFKKFVKEIGLVD